MVDERTAHRAFRALLLAHAYPGRPQAGPCTSAAATFDALMDAVWCDAPVPPVVVDGADASARLIAADRGTEIEPERGATIVRVETPGASPRTRVRLSGPGVNGELRTSLALRESELRARAEACAAYPLGIDVVMIDASGAITALPRTVRASCE